MEAMNWLHRHFINLPREGPMMGINESHSWTDGSLYTTSWDSHHPSSLGWYSGMRREDSGCSGSWQGESLNSSWDMEDLTRFDSA